MLGADVGPSQQGCNYGNYKNVGNLDGFTHPCNRQFTSYNTQPGGSPTFPAIQSIVASDTRTLSHE